MYKYIVTIILSVFAAILYSNIPQSDIEKPIYHQIMESSKPLKAFVLGGTGTVGKSIVKALIEHPNFEKITLIGRRNLELDSIANHPGFQKIDQKIINFEETSKYANEFKGYDVGFCALGISSVGVTKEQHYHITYDYVVETAQLAHAGGCKEFHFVSGQGTSKDSLFAWARTKAEVEEKLSQMGFERLSIYRPAGIIKDKAEVSTTGESIGICAWKILDPFHLMSVDTNVLGKVMVNNTFRVSKPMEILENADILRLGQPWPEEFTVALDGSGNFTTIQAAVNATRDLSQVQVRIYIKSGTYREKLVIPSWKTNISLIGENNVSTIITNDDHWGKPLPCLDPIGGDRINTFTSYTVLVQGNDFSATNLTIENTSGPVGQAVALHIEADRVQLSNCQILGHQDTVYAATSGSRQYYRSCHIQGTTDFIFGEATALFDNCLITSLSSSYITAASTREHQKFGFVFRNCTLVAAINATRVYLGRPWRPHAKTVFLNTKMGEHILPAGWHNWNDPDNEKTAFYAEYMSTGVNASQRVVWSNQLTKKEAQKYTIENIFAVGQLGWIPQKTNQTVSLSEDVFKNRYFLKCMNKIQ